MVASLTDVEHGIEVGSLSAAGQHTAYTAFQRSNLCRHSVVGGVLQTGIEISLFLQVEELGHLVRVVILESGALDDRQLDGFAVFGFVACLHTE